VVWAFVVTLGVQATEFISDGLRTLKAREGRTLKYKQFWDRLAQASFARFMRELFQGLCRELSLRILERDARAISIQFSAIFIDDGSWFAVANGRAGCFLDGSSRSNLRRSNCMRIWICSAATGARDAGRGQRGRAAVDVPTSSGLPTQGLTWSAGPAVIQNPIIVRALWNVAAAARR
jgi:hypothetical protein